MHITKWKKPIWRGYILYDSSIWHSGKDKKHWDSKKTDGCQGLEGREVWTSRAQRIFMAVKEKPRN